MLTAQRIPLGRGAIDAMAGELRGRGCDARLGLIEFTDPRYEGHFKVFPMPHPFREVLGMLPIEVRATRSSTSSSRLS